MLELRTAKGNLILDPKTRIRFTYMFPMFVTDAIPNVVSYAFDIPDDIGGFNRSIIGSSPTYDAVRKIRKLSISIIFSGEELDSGLLLCTGCSGRKFRCIFLSTPFADGFEGKKMQELKYLLNPIVLGETTQQIVAEVKSLSQKFYPHTDVVFPSIYAPNFYGDTNKDFAGVLNATDNAENYIINEIAKEWEPGDPEEGDYETNENSLIPAFFQRSIIRDIFKSQGYKVIGNFFTSPKTKNAIILGNKAADRVEYTSWVDANITGHTDISQQRVFNSNNYKKGNDLTYSGQDATTVKKGYYEVSVDNLTVEYVQNVRILYLNISFDSGFITETLTVQNNDDTITGISFFARFWHDGTALKNIRVWCNHNYQPVSGTITIRGVSQNSLNKFAKSVSIGEYFSGIEVSTMVNAIRQQWGLLLFVDKQRSLVQVELAADIIANAPAANITKWVISDPEKEFADRKKYTISYDWDDSELMTPLDKTNILELTNSFNLPTPLKNSIVKILNQFRYLTTEEQDDGTFRWKEDVTFIKDVITPGIEAEEYKPNLQSLISHNLGVPNNDWANKTIIPYLPGEGKSDVFGNNNEIKLTAISYHGWVGINTAYTYYPYASIDNVHNLGFKDASIQSLRMDGDDGLYKKVLKPMLDIVGNHEIATVDIFPAMDSLRTILKVFKPVIESEPIAPRKVLIKGVDLWVKQLDFEITNHAVVSAQLKLAKPEYEY